MTRWGKRAVLAKNAIVNVGRGGISSVIALLLPPFLTRSMSRDAFGAWCLVLQLSAYVGFFDFGIQTAVTRFVSLSSEQRDYDRRNTVVSTAFALLVVSGILAFLVILIVVSLVPNVFHQINAPLRTDLRVSLLIVGGSLAINLPASVFAGSFVGLQRNEIPAAAISIPRILGAALVVFVVRHGGSLISMAAATAASNLTSFALQYVVFHKYLQDIRLSISHVSKIFARELLEYCFSLTVWGVGLLLVTGLDLAIVGVYRFDQVAYYAIAATLITFFNGFFGAIFWALGAPATVLYARNDKAGLGRFIDVTTRFGMVLLLAAGLPIFFCTHAILRIWVGPAYAENATILVQLLVVANVIRICVSPYIVAMISTGEQRRIIFVPLLEGAVNLAASVIAGYYLGAVGVALGTLIGSVVSLVGHTRYTMRKNIAIDLKAGDYLFNSLLRPTLCAAPIIGIAASWHYLPVFLQPGLSTIAGSLSLVLFFAFCLTPSERHRLEIQLRSVCFRND